MGLVWAVGAMGACWGLGLEWGGKGGISIVWEFGGPAVMATVGNLMHFIGFRIERGQPVAHAKWCNRNSLEPTIQTFVCPFYWNQ